MKTTMTKPRVSEGARIRDLITLLTRLSDLYDELFALVDEKIAAMRRADLDAMRACGDKEQLLARTLHERQGLRIQLMEALGKELGLPPAVARAITVSQLATHIPAPQRKVLTDAADRLRATIAKVAQANRVAGVISRELVNHLRWVFAAVRPQDDRPVDYGDAGVLVSRPATYLFEAVG